MLIYTLNVAALVNSECECKYNDASKNIKKIFNLIFVNK